MTKGWGKQNEAGFAREPSGRWGGAVEKVRTCDPLAGSCAERGAFNLRSRPGGGSPVLPFYR